MRIALRENDAAVSPSTHLQLPPRSHSSASGGSSSRGRATTRPLQQLLQRPPVCARRPAPPRACPGSRHPRRPASTAAHPKPCSACTAESNSPAQTSSTAQTFRESKNQTNGKRAGRADRGRKIERNEWANTVNAGCGSVHAVARRDETRAGRYGRGPPLPLLKAGLAAAGGLAAKLPLQVEPAVRRVGPPSPPAKPPRVPAGLRRRTRSHHHTDRRRFSPRNSRALTASTLRVLATPPPSSSYRGGP